jgi:molecular chaperone DnaJ
MAKDYYSILGVQKNASKDEIKKAFRKLAHEHHPDKKGGNEAKFKEVNEAYSVLNDDTKRSQYDTFGSGFQGSTGGAGFNPNDFGGFDFSQFNQGGSGNGVEFDLGDIFGDFFGGRQGRQQRRGRDISMDIEISFKESIFGVEREILLNKVATCDVCGGNGAKKGSSMDTCSVCNGKGKVHEVRRSIIGSFSTTRTCDNCHGTGKVPKEKCETCKGQGVLKRDQTIRVRIPAGIDDGEMVRLASQGESVTQGTAGDLYIKVHVTKHSQLRKEGSNLVMSLKIKLTDAILGVQYPIKTLDGDIVLKIPEGISYREVLRVKGKGVPTSSSRRGDLLVQITFDIPRKPNSEVKKLIEELRKKGV